MSDSEYSTTSDTEYSIKSDSVSSTRTLGDISSTSENESACPSENEFEHEYSAISENESAVSVKLSIIFANLSAVSVNESQNESSDTSENESEEEPSAISENESAMSEKESVMSDNESENESSAISENESENESEKETSAISENESENESEKETSAISENESENESEKETSAISESESEKEFEKETSAISENEPEKETSAISKTDLPTKSEAKSIKADLNVTWLDEVKRMQKLIHCVSQEADCNIGSSRGKPTMTCPFLTLPEQIRLKIFNYVPTRQRVFIQLVCKLFRYEIRVRCGVTGYINEETSWGLTFLRDIICDTIIVGRYQQPHLTPTQLIFRPKLVKYLLFKGPNSVQYMDAFVTRCSRIIRMSVHCSVIEKAQVPCNLDMRREYKAWRKVDAIKRFPRRLMECLDLEICPIGKQPAFTIQYVLELCSYVVLERVAIKITDPIRVEEARKIHMAVFDLLKKSPQIRDIIINTRLVKEDKKFLTRLNLLRPEKEIVQTSRKVELRQLSLTEEVVDFHTWSSFLLEQKKIEVLQVLHLCFYPAIFYVIKNNVATLKKIGIHSVLQYELQRVNTNMFLDLTVFSDCPNLQELFICIGGPYFPGEADLTNFKQLPPSLEVLAIRNATFQARDFLNVAKLPKLRSLGVITYAGTGLASHNMSSKVLQLMLEMRSLNELLMQGFTLTVQGVRDVYVMGKLTNSLTLGQPNTLYIRDSKNPDSNRWVIGGEKDEFLFRLFDSRVFEM